MVAGRLLALVAVACLHIATAFVCYGCPRLVLRDQLHAGQPLSRHMQNNLWPAEPMRRHRAAPASKRRCAIMSVGEHVDDSRTVDGSGSFDPVCVVSPHDAGTPVLWVLPSDESPKSDGVPSIALLPGFGWGEGTHPSTYMCLQYICDKTSKGCTVMDYGTGSGVLAVAAAAMGAARAVGVDKDDDILAHAAENAEKNSLEAVEVVNGREVMVGSHGLYIGDDHRVATFDVVVANMLPAALVKLSATIAMSVKEETGVLALCGCNRAEVDSVVAAFAKVGIEFTGERSAKGAAPGAAVKEYVLLMGRRPKQSAEEQKAMIDFLSDAAAT